MAITYPLDLPTSIGFAQISLTAMNVNSVSTSPFTLKQQVLQWPGQRWMAEVSIPPVQRREAEPWVAFLMSLQGRVGTFLLGDPSGANPQGLAKDYTDTLAISGASQTGSSVVIDGAEPSITGYLKAGDYLQIGTAADSRLYKVLQDADSSAGGVVSLDVWPSLRGSPADNTSVSVKNAKGLFRLDQGNSQFSISSSNSYGISFSAVEVV